MNDQSTVFDVAICGTGPAGMVASLLAAKAGLTTALIGPDINVEDRRTTALLAPSLDTLKAVDLDEAIAEFGTPLVTMRLMDGSRRLLRAPTVSFEAHEIGHNLFGLNCPNAPLNKAFHAAVEAVQVRRFVGTVVRYSVEDDPLQLTLSDGQIVRCRSVIAADGKNSPARQAVGVGAKRWTYPQTAAVGVVRHAKPHDHISTEFHTESGPFTFVPMPDEDGSHRSSFVCALKPDRAQALAAMSLEDGNRFLEERALHLLGALELEGPVQLWPLEALVAHQFAAKGVYLIGETAHAFPPIGAQGLNLSIRDARDAVEVIAQGIADGAELRGHLLAARYTAKRRADVWSRTLGVDALNRSLLSNNPLVQVGRVAAMTVAGMSPVLKKGLMVAGLEPLALGGLITAWRSSTRQSEPA